MTLDEFREHMASYRLAVDAEGASFKDSQWALEKLDELYRKFDAAEREMADQVLTEWALSEDENVRFDAQSLIADFKIAKAVAALEQLATRLRFDTSPGAPHEKKKVERILAELTNILA